MGVPRFYMPQLVPGVVRLSDAEGRHAAGARRLSVEDCVAVFDGRGHEAQARIESAGRSGVEIHVEAITFRPRPRPGLSLAVALPKGPRQDVLMEKCTELGVVAIQPILTQRSVCGASEHRVGKWRRTAIEAAKQSGQAWLPSLETPIALAELLARAAAFTHRLVAMPGAAPLQVLAGAESVLMLIGPEGGWAEAEQSAIIAAGAVPVSLGPNILRIETAAIAAAAIFHAASRLDDGRTDHPGD